MRVGRLSRKLGRHHTHTEFQISNFSSSLSPPPHSHPHSVHNHPHLDGFRFRKWRRSECIWTATSETRARSTMGREPCRRLQSSSISWRSSLCTDRFDASTTGYELLTSQSSSQTPLCPDKYDISTAGCELPTSQSSSQTPPCPGISNVSTAGCELPTIRSSIWIWTSLRGVGGGDGGDE